MSADSIRLAILLAWVLGGVSVLIFVLVAAASLMRSGGRSLLRMVAEEFQGTLFLGGLDNIDQVTFRYRDAAVSVRHTADSLSQVLMTTPDPALRLELTTEEPQHIVRKLLGMQDIVVGNPPFDAAFVVQGGNEGAVRRFLTPAVQAAALSLFRFKPQWPLGRGQTRLHIQIGPELLGVTRGLPLADEAEMLGFVRATLALYDAAIGAKTPEGIDFLDAKSSVVPRCMVCGEELIDDIVHCRRCHTPHHRECWNYCGGCSTYGCGERQLGSPP